MSKGCDFVEGDVVVLKSGGPLMTVGEVISDGDLGKVHFEVICDWFGDDGLPHDARFCEWSVEKVTLPGNEEELAKLVEKEQDPDVDAARDIRTERQIENEMADLAAHVSQIDDSMEVCLDELVRILVEERLSKQVIDVIRARTNRVVGVAGKMPVDIEYGGKYDNRLRSR